jgi:transposase-like protein
MKNVKEPKTLQEAIVTFSDPDNALWYMVAKRWPEGVVCPTCGRTDVNFLAKQRRWQCKSKHALRQFTAKVGTIFEDSPLPLEKWLPAVWMITNDKNGVSSWEIHRALGVTQKTAWFMLHRIRLAMQNNSLLKLGGGGGEVEADESFIGGKSRNMHKHIRAKRITRTGGGDKAMAFGILERKGEVRAMVLTDRQKAPFTRSSRSTFRPVQRCSLMQCLVSRTGRGLCASGYRPRDCLCGWTGSHQRAGELLELSQAVSEWHLHQRGTIPSVPVLGRAELSLQQTGQERQSGR